MPAAQKPPARRRMIHPSICLQRKARMGGRGMVNACVLATAAAYSAQLHACQQPHAALHGPMPPSALELLLLEAFAG